MIIANPIFDGVFKRLMENERIAKFFIGTLLNETIESVKLKPQEFTYTIQLAGVAVYRVDFIAIIKTESGEFKKVLIEIQKAKNIIDLMRFRNYLAEQYKKADETDTDTGKKKVALPIVTIYMLGFSLPEIESSALSVRRNYIDLNTNIILDIKSSFIESLTHDCYVVQLLRIKPKYRTKLDKLLSVFEQANFVDDKKIIKKYDYEIDEEVVKEMTDILHYIGTDPDEKKQIEDEQEAWRTIDAMTEDLRMELMIKNKKLEDQADLIKNQAKLMEDQAKLIEEFKTQDW